MMEQGTQFKFTDYERDLHNPTFGKQIERLGIVNGPDYDSHITAYVRDIDTTIVVAKHNITEILEP